MSASGPFLVLRQDEGYGDVHPLEPGQRYTLGRANTNRIVLRDELCSRDHSEIYHDDEGWHLRDLKSLNGTRIQGQPIQGTHDLVVGDEVQMGRSTFLFVDQLDDLPARPFAQEPESSESWNIKKRLSQTQARFLTPLPENTEEAILPMKGVPRRSLSRDLGLLYRLALDMGSVTLYEDLVRIVLDGLLEGVPAADVGAILTMREGRELEVTAHRHRDPSITAYTRVSEFVSNEVLSQKDAILAEDVGRDRYLRDRESITHLGATSLICAPIIDQTKVLGLIHLYCVDPHKSLAAEDLEFTMAVSKQLSIATVAMHRQTRLFDENQNLRSQLQVESELVGESPAIRDILDQVGRVAATNATVLIRGESGSGKELVARAIHYSSPRKAGPFICLNCAAIAESLLESELFGHERGAFTGATEKKVGKFEAAHHGTIFLDEIGEMAVNTQAKLLRILEGHPFERVGGHIPIKVDVRVVAATNQPLEDNIREGKFRRDLFFRLQVVEVVVPPLRNRPTDVMLLADHFLKRFIRETGRKLRGFSPAAIQKMEHHNWPGNVRELRNVVERAVALGRGPWIDAPDIWLSSLELPGVAASSSSNAFEPMTLEEIEKVHIRRTLEHTQWNKSQAANLLAIERSTLDRKIKSYGLKAEE